MELREKIKLGLDESRILVLGGQVLLGFQFRALFQNGLEQLPGYARYLLLVGLLFIALSVALLIAIASYHRIAERGEDSESFARFLSAMMCAALLPLTVGFAIDLYVVALTALGQTGALVLAAIGGAFAVTMLYGIELVQRSRRARQVVQKRRVSQAMVKETKLKDRIDHVLTEARLVLPGAQALLGFQFLIFLAEPFGKLPYPLKLIHLGSLACVSIATILLMTPASYHRIVERGEDTPHIYAVSSALVLIATIPLGIGIAGDFFVAVQKVTGDSQAALTLSLLLIAVTYGLWFGVPLAVRLRRVHQRRPLEATNP